MPVEADTVVFEGLDEPMGDAVLPAQAADLVHQHFLDFASGSKFLGTNETKTINLIGSTLYGFLQDFYDLVAFGIGIGLEFSDLPVCLLLLRTHTNENGNFGGLHAQKCRWVYSNNQVFS